MVTFNYETLAIVQHPNHAINYLARICQKTHFAIRVLMLIFYAKAERLTYIAAAVERFEGHDLQLIYYKWPLRVMYYFKLMIFNTISFLNDLVCIMVYIDRYIVTTRYFESIFTDMIFMTMRYDNAVNLGWV